NKILFDWQIAMHNHDGTPRRGLMPTFLRFSVVHGLLPEAYLLGLARTSHFTGQRRAYLMGEYSDTGWRSYFPLAFAVKTPLPIQLLLLAGVAALVLRRARIHDVVLLAGLLGFGLIYGAFMIKSSVNIGHRHLLPLYPLIFVLASASAVWLTTRLGRWLAGGALLWLLIANLWVHPHYLAYYNELIGGPSRGYHYLVDSSTDWGQDLLRLAEYAERHPGESIKLAYFGSAVPTRYLACTSLASYFDFGPRAELNAGTYVVSVTQLTGVYDLEIRDTFWTPRYRAGYAALGELASRPPAEGEPPEVRERRAEAAREFEELRHKRLLNRLRRREPDDRIGYSLLVYRLSDADVERLTRP
ncbi:MAG: hypothetical protein KAY37_14470, partial [Phycisphaerae bacterium]|nr:hypothetical protein [Phycisphaerae bacterium]